MLVKTYCAAVNGLEVTTVTVEVSVTKGVKFHLTGLADTAVKESRDRIVSALKNNGIKHRKGQNRHALALYDNGRTRS